MGHMIPLRIMPFLNNSFWSLSACQRTKAGISRRLSHSAIYGKHKNFFYLICFSCSFVVDPSIIFRFFFFCKFHTFTELELSFSQQPEMLACSGSLPFLVVLFTVDYFPKIKEWSLLTLKLLSASVTLCSSCKNSQKMN